MDDIKLALDLAEMELKAMYERNGYTGSNVLSQVQKAQEQVKNCSMSVVNDLFSSEKITEEAKKYAMVDDDEVAKGSFDVVEMWAFRCGANWAIKRIENNC